MLKYSVKYDVNQDGIKCTPTIIFEDEKGDKVPYILPEGIELKEAERIVPEFANIITKMCFNIHGVREFILRQNMKK